MNVTVRLPDELCRQARHRAVDESKSLSAWLAELIRRELSTPAPADARPKSWVEAFSSDYPDWFYEKDFPLEDRKAGRTRGVAFEKEEGA